MVFSGLYPVDADDYEDLKTALEKLQLNDASLVYEPETSVALGFGFRCGFLGFLHAEIVQERLEREYDLNLITTAPTVRYRVVLRSGEEHRDREPGGAARPRPTIERIEEPMILATIHVPPEYVGAVLALCQERRGRQRDMAHHGIPRAGALRAAARRGGLRLPRPDQERDAAATAPSTTTGSATSPRTWSSSTCSSTATRSTRSR